MQPILVNVFIILLSLSCNSPTTSKSGESGFQDITTTNETLIYLDSHTDSIQISKFMTHDDSLEIQKTMDSLNKYGTDTGVCKMIKIK